LQNISIQEDKSPSITRYKGFAARLKKTSMGNSARLWFVDFGCLKEEAIMLTFRCESNSAIYVFDHDSMFQIP
jgi:hypothetical protein